MKIQKSGEDYLETILILQKRNRSVRSVDVANELGFSKPSISRAMGILKANGYIAIDAQGCITLTDRGEAKASDVYERHTILAKCLVALGVDPKTAAEDACRMEHVISEQTFAKIKEHLLQH